MASTLTPVPPEPPRADDRAPAHLTSVPTAGPAPEPHAPASPATPSPEAGGRPVTIGRAVAVAILLAAGLLLAFVGYLTIGSGLAASRAQDVMYRDLRTDLEAATVPVSGVIAPGTPLGVVSVPKIHLEQVFVEGSTSRQTAHGPGLRTDTVLPGQAGLSVLLGHRSTQGAAFMRLAELRPGDVIDVTTGQGRSRFVVDMVRTSDAPESRVRVVPSRLSLVTSDPTIAPNRTLTVSARLVGKAKPASTGYAASAAEQAGKGTSTGLVPLLLWSQLLLLVSVLATWAALRLPRAAVWLGATPVLLAVLWHVFENLALLLPNTL